MLDGICPGDKCGVRLKPLPAPIVECLFVGFDGSEAVVILPKAGASFLSDEVASTPLPTANSDVTVPGFVVRVLLGSLSKLEGLDAGIKVETFKWTHSTDCRAVAGRYFAGQLSDTPVVSCTEDGGVEAAARPTAGSGALAASSSRNLPDPLASLKSSKLRKRINSGRQ